ncbi:hypothetical protein P5G63_03140 [Aeromonas salmonicida]|uniref:hypothetical protein n=1 Tax=Aeromonas salmonicida TaxID=645 RepID=UPI0023F2150D|nr:hypothetical protein [Aeromonas salmonicida]MDF8327538.1 hypothetical protein [Aeromonas salmonicida]
MQIQALQILVNQQISQLGHADQAGRLGNSSRGNISSGASSQEHAFASAVLEQVRNIALNHQEVAGLLPHIANFKLQQDTGGNAVLAGLRSNQLSLADAKLLLDVASRQLPPPLPERATKAAPALPPVARTAWWICATISQDKMCRYWPANRPTAPMLPPFGPVPANRDSSAYLFRTKA